MGYKWFRFIFISLLVLFLVLYISQSTGYHEFEQHRKVVLTEAKIKEFEADIKSGKKIDVNDYIVDITKNYNNKMSTSGLKLSKSLAKGYNNVIGTMYKVIRKLFID